MLHSCQPNLSDYVILANCGNVYDRPLLFVNSKRLIDGFIVESRKTPPKVGKEQNVVYIGNKSPMDYVMTAITAFNVSDTSEVVLKARGRAISTADDVAEITRNWFFKDAKVHSVAIGTEEATPREGGNPRNVSTMGITIKK